jgi:hypothetical protein
MGEKVLDESIVVVLFFGRRPKNCMGLHYLRAKITFKQYEFGPNHPK